MDSDHSNIKQMIVVIATHGVKLLLFNYVDVIEKSKDYYYKKISEKFELNAPGCLELSIKDKAPTYLFLESVAPNYSIDELFYHLEDKFDLKQIKQNCSLMLSSMCSLYETIKPNVENYLELKLPGLHVDDRNSTICIGDYPQGNRVGVCAKIPNP